MSKKSVRAQFEIWVRRNAGLLTPPVTLLRIGNSYASANVQFAWEAYRSVHKRLKPRATLVHRAMAEPVVTLSNDVAGGLSHVPLYELEDQE